MKEKSVSVKSRWSDDEAGRFIDQYGADYGEDIALRVYTSRLIGADPDLVLHGGGNTSVKASHTTLLGKSIPAIYVKGSGWDLKSIEPPGFPGLDLTYLQKLRALDTLSDEGMVNELRTHMFDAAGPTPSVETLLHAFIDDAFVDHSHADAIVALTNNVDAERMLSDCYGDDITYVPYVMPGFQLSKLAGEIYDSNPDSAGMVLLNHGLFTWGASARESYERHIALVDRAQAFLAGLKTKRTFTVSSPPPLDPLDVMPRLRGAFQKRRMVLTLRRSKAIERFVNSPELLEAARTGPLTPDHIIRTKELPLILHDTSDVEAAFTEYQSNYDEYFNRCRLERGTDVTKLDSLPRIILVPGLGLVAVGESAKAAGVAADIYEHTIAVKTLVASISEYRALPQLDLFDVEYWSLEQAKLGKHAPKPLEGQVAVVTGGAGAVGHGICRILKNAGAEVVLTDLQNATETARELGCMGIDHDTTSQQSTRDMLREVCARFGGVDILVPNAGIALSAPIERLDETETRRVMDVNFHGYLNVVQEAGKLMMRQGTGGNIVLVSSKNVFAPGNEFAAYSASKAAAHQLGKVAALEFAPHGIRVNMVAPDAVFCSESDPPGTIRSGLWKEVGAERAKAHHVELDELENFYKDRNLLKTAVTAEDVGRAVLFFATNQTPTTGATLPVDGGVPGAFPR